MLVAGRFDDLERLDEGGRMKAGEWRRGLDEFGKTLIAPPPEDLESADVIPVSGTNDSWSVWYRLWTKQEGKSDLSLELTVRDSGGGQMHIELDGLRVE